MAVAIACHLDLVAWLLRPASRRIDVTPATESDATALQVRFILASRPAAAPPTPSRPATHPAIPSRPAPATPPVSSPVHRVARAAKQLPDTAAANIPPIAPDRRADDQASAGDGGFRERLRNALHSRDVHGIPGSDTPIVPGIRLADPTDQGIGAVMRRAQRLFGVTSRHCIDIEVWQHLTPEQLADHHLSPDDLKRQAEKYQCNRPLGLSF